MKAPEGNAGTEGTTGRLAWLEERIRQAAHLLPAQGPIGVFIYHNTLHAFEHLTFDEVVRAGSGCLGVSRF